MKTSGIKILAVSAVLLTMASALAWQPEVLYGFPLGPGNPSSLVQGSDGSFYGTTTEGGIAGKGTVFKVTTNGVFTTLVSFTGPNVANPQAWLVLGNDGNLYGTTSLGSPWCVS